MHRWIELKENRENLMTDFIALENDIPIGAILSIRDMATLCIVENLCLGLFEEWSKDVFREFAHARESLELPPLEEILENRLNLIVCMMCREDILGPLLTSNMFKELVPLLTSYCFDGSFPRFCEGRDIFFFAGKCYILSIAKIRNKVSITI